MIGTTGFQIHNSEDLQIQLQINLFWITRRPEYFWQNVEGYWTKEWNQELTKNSSRKQFSHLSAGSSCHSSSTMHSSSFRFRRSALRNADLRHLQRFFNGTKVRSHCWPGLKTLDLLFFNHSSLELDVCFELSSCWKSQDLGLTRVTRFTLKSLVLLTSLFLWYNNSFKYLRTSTLFNFFILSPIQKWHCIP